MGGTMSRPAPMTPGPYSGPMPYLLTFTTTEERDRWIARRFPGLVEREPGNYVTPDGGHLYAYANLHDLWYEPLPWLEQLYNRGGRS
jgi:hypothetical protein